MIWHWLSAFAHERYCANYWEQVAQNERWLQVLTELMDKNDED